MLAIRKGTSVEISILTNWIHRSKEFLRPLQGAQHIPAFDIVTLAPHF
jgi:hypothetical protein